MGIIHYSENRLGLTYIVRDGEVIWADWLEHIRALMADPEWRAMQRFIADLQSVTDTSRIQDQQVELASAFIADNRETLATKTGAVTASEEFWRAQRFGTSTVVFNAPDTACHFLGIEPAAASQTIEKLRSKLREKGS